VRRTRAGLTLLELLVAVSILAVLVLGLLAFFTRYLGAVAKQDDLTAGLVLAQRVLDRAVEHGTYATPAANLTAGVYSHDSSSQSTFFYSLTSTPSAVTPLSTKQVYWLEVRVTWWGDDSSPRANLGRLSTTVRRLVAPP
jgi:prepilin-type N-terminal cleavage/methylation domain-containing protein